MEVVLPIECEIPSLKLAIGLLLETTPMEEWLLYLEKLDEQSHDAVTANEVYKTCVKAQYDKMVQPRVY